MTTTDPLRNVQNGRAPDYDVHGKEPWAAKKTERESLACAVGTRTNSDYGQFCRRYFFLVVVAQGLLNVCWHLAGQQCVRQPSRSKPAMLYIVPISIDAAFVRGTQDRLASFVIFGYKEKTHRSIQFLWWAFCPCVLPSSAPISVPASSDRS